MRDYWLTQELFKAAGFGFIALAATGIGLALWLPKKWWGKLLALIAVGALVSIPVRKAQEENKQQQVQVDEFKVRYAKAKALFDERCKTSGEKVYRTVENVEGIRLDAMRPEASKSAQFELQDQAGDDAHDIGFLETFFMGRENEFLLTDRNRSGAYKYVEVRNRQGGYTQYFDARTSLSDQNLGRYPLRTELRVEGSAQYAVSSEDLSTREDRENWIAGSRIRVIDIKLNEVIGERVGYIFDNGFGATQGGRSPWAFATYNACPELPKLHGQYPYKRGLTRNFLEKLAKPRQENSGDK